MGSVGALGNFVGGIFQNAADIYKAKEAAKAAQRIAEIDRQERLTQAQMSADQRRDLLVSAGLFLVGGLVAYQLVKKAI